MQNKVEEIKKEHDLISQSIDFWADEISRLFTEIDKLDDNPDDLNYEEKLESLINKLQKLINKGEKEEQILDQFEEKFNELVNDIVPKINSTKADLIKNKLKTAVEILIQKNLDKKTVKGY